MRLVERSWVSMLGAFLALATACGGGGGGGGESGGRALSGTVWGAGYVTGGVDVEVTGASARTDASGRYTLASLDAGTWIVEPFRLGYKFRPALRSVTVADEDVTGIDFVIADAAARGTVSRLELESSTLTIGGTACPGVSAELVNWTATRLTGLSLRVNIVQGSTSGPYTTVTVSGCGAANGELDASSTCSVEFDVCAPSGAGLAPGPARLAVDLRPTGQELRGGATDIALQSP